jgi:hypothetical protein
MNSFGYTSPNNESGRADPPAGSAPARCERRGLGLAAGLLGHDAADVDQASAITPRPTQRFRHPLVLAAIESVPSLNDADATVAAGAPFLAVAEPALLLLAFAVRAFGGAIGDADALDALGFGGRLVFGRVEADICRLQARCAA